MHEAVTYIRSHFRMKKTAVDHAGPPLERWIIEDWPGAFCVNRTKDGTGDMMPLLKSQWERVYKDPMTQQWRPYHES